MNKRVKIILKYICSLIASLINKGQYFIINRAHKSMISRLHLRKVEQSEYLKYAKWIRSYGFKPAKSDFMLFYPYLNHLEYGWKIVPAYVVHNYINPILNPIEMRGFYEDKNSFEKLISNCLPHALLKRIHGRFYNADYVSVDIQTEADLVKVLECHNKIIVKPSVESSSGNGIKFFTKKDDSWISASDGEKLSIELLDKEWGDDFIIQEVLTQSSFMSQFNPSSINTLRMVTYRSVVDDEVSLLWAIIRIGGAGSFVDNAHSGGVYVGVDADGKLNHYVCNQYGEVFYEHNGVDFKNTDFVVPDYDKIVDFVKDAANKVLHHRLIAFDVAVDGNNEYKIIEFNLRGFSGWLGEFSGFLKFGDKADEILKYCSRQKHLAKKVFFQIG